MYELGGALVEILDFFKLSQIACVFGEGAGANICKTKETK